MIQKCTKLLKISLRLLLLLEQFKESLKQESPISIFYPLFILKLCAFPFQEINLDFLILEEKKPYFR